MEQLAGLNIIGLISGAIAVVLTVIPFWIIFPRLGYSKWYSLLSVIPFAGMLFLYIVAFKKKKPQRGEIKDDACKKTVQSCNEDAVRENQD